MEQTNKHSQINLSVPTSNTGFQSSTAGADVQQIKNEPRQFIVLSNVHQPNAGGSTYTIAQLNNLSGIPAQNITMLSAAPIAQAIHPIHGAPAPQSLQIAPIIAYPATTSAHGAQIIQKNGSGVYTLQAGHTTMELVQPSINDYQPMLIQQAHNQSNRSVKPELSKTCRSRLRACRATTESREEVKNTKLFQKRSHVQLSEYQQLKINFLDQMGVLASEIRSSAEKIQQTHKSDAKLSNFAQSVASFAMLTHSTLLELNNHIGNQASHINGILLRRGGTVQPFQTVVGNNDKIHFDLTRCDHKQTLYDSERQTTVDLLELFEKFFIGKPKLQIPAYTQLTPRSGRIVYGIQVWGLFSSSNTFLGLGRNGHRTVPHVLIEELKTQIAKGFGVYGTALGSQVNLSIGAAVINKATRFFNAKRRVSTRASQKSALKSPCKTSKNELNNGDDVLMEVGTTESLDDCEHAIKVVNADNDASLFSNLVDSDDLGIEQKRVFDKSDSLLAPSGRRKFLTPASLDLQINGRQSLLDDEDTRPPAFIG